MKIFSFFKTFRHQLTSVGKKEPIHFFSLLIIIALDIFVLSNLFQGLSFQKQQLDSPSEVIPYACENYLPDNSLHLSETDIRKNNLSTLEMAVESSSYFGSVTNKYASAIEIIEDNNKEIVHADCRAIFAQSNSLHDSKLLASYFDDIEKIDGKIYDLERDIRELEDSYDTQLLEKIANQSDELSLTNTNANTIKSTLTGENSQLLALKSEVLKIENLILADNDAVKFLALAKSKQANITAVKADLKFWYPLKKLAVQMMFLLPLFLFFLWQYSRMSKKENSLMSLIFSHLFLVTLIPIVLKVFELMFEIIPFHLFEDLLELLEALNIIALWNYVLIALSIAFAFAVIYFLQKKVFSAEITWRKRLAKKKCWNCGKNKVSQTEKFCSFCSEPQLEKCQKCGDEKFCKAKFCNKCGE